MNALQLHCEQALTAEGKPISYQWLVLEKINPVPGCDESFRVFAECARKQDAELIVAGLGDVKFSMVPVSEPVPCPVCSAPVFIRPNKTIVAHYSGYGHRCEASEKEISL